MGLTKSESYNGYTCIFLGQPMQEYIMCELPKQNQGLKPKYK